jgi:TatD DNase family protein
MNFVDTHAHLDFPQFDDDRDQVIKRATDVGVTRFINVGTTLERSRRAVEIAANHDPIWATVGIHPSDAGEVDEGAITSLKELVEQPKVVAIGEVGFDFFHDSSPSEEAQRVAFFAQSEIAWRAGLPIIIHSREAETVTLKALKQHAEEAQAANVSRDEFGVVHCFTGSRDFAIRALDLGYLISFTAPVGYPKNDDLREVVKAVPLEKIMLETDCPFLPPADRRGDRNEPAFLIETAKVIAELKGVSLEELGEATSTTAERLFRLH